MAYHIPHRLLCALTIPFLLCLAFADGASAALCAGAARVDITPPVGVWLSGYGHRKQPSTAVADPLYAKALVLDDGRSKIAIVSTDLLWVPLEITREVRRRVNKEVGIPEDHIMVCGTHTHWGPKVDRPGPAWPDAAESRISDDYVNVLTGKVAACIIEAHRKLSDAPPAAVAMTKGHIDEISYNRRTVRPDGTVVNTFRLPPASPDLKFGPTDPTVSILKVQDPAGRLVAAVVNFACHPVSGDADPDLFYQISADYPAVVESLVEKTEGGTCLFLLGTAGNINPVRYKRTRFRHEIGAALGGEVLRRLQTVTARSDVKLKGMIRPITFDLKPAEGQKPEDAGKLNTEVQLLTIGDIYILGLPSEVLVEIGLAIKEKAGLEKLLVVSIANDTCGYICTKEAYEQGGYESTSATRLAPGAGEHLAEEALALIDTMKSDNK